MSNEKVKATDAKIPFKEIPLHQVLHEAITSQGFEYCTPIQAISLPYSLCGNDIVGQAQTGSGKTAAFLITIIQHLLNNPSEHSVEDNNARSVVVAPTRELAMQIADDAIGLCRQSSLNVVTLVGGTDYEQQKQQLLNKKPDIVVATPGRLLDFCSQKYLNLKYVEILVLDEADRMLDMGFIPQVRRIVRMIPTKEYRQTLFFSATLHDKVSYLVNEWTYEAKVLEVETQTGVADSITQLVYIVSATEKYQLLCRLLKQKEVENAIVFVNRRDECRWLSNKLSEDKYSVAMISGEMDQKKRIKNLSKFKEGQYQILVATDVAGRGIHIDGISHVFNYSLPDDVEDYVHRIGRTGRAGKQGVSISFACEDDSFKIEPIEAMLGEKLNCQLMPELFES